MRSSPAIGSDGTVYVGSFDNNLYAVNPDGTEKWNYTTGGTVRSPAIGSDGTVYVGSFDNNLYAIGGENDTDEEDDTNGIPGFTLLVMLISTFVAVIYNKKKRTR